MRPGPAACTGISGAEQWDRGCGRAGDGGASGGSGVREQGAELGERSRGRRQGGKRPILLLTQHNLKRSNIKLNLQLQVAVYYRGVQIIRNFFRPF